MTLPLSGLRIIAIEQYGAGPYASLFLAQMGAEVIKIENPAGGGDVSRLTGPYFLGPDDSEFFQTFNQNKKSLTLNLKAPEGRAIFEQLVTTADAVMHNLRGDQAGKLRITYDDLGPLNPKIVCGHLTAYGRDGERAAWPGYDYLMQAEAGFLALTGEPDGPPVRFGLSMVDFMTGMMLAYGLTAAVLGARTSGRGRDVDVSLFDAALHQLSYPATWYLNEGHVTGRAARSAHPSITPSQLVETKDGWIFVMCQTDKFWTTFLDAIDTPEIGTDSRFATLPDRLTHRNALTAALDKIFKAHPTEHWLRLLRGLIPVAPVHDLAEALDNPHLEESGMIATVAHRERERLRLLANPIKLDGHRVAVTAAPALGGDTDAVLASLGYDAAAIAALRTGKVI